MSPERWQQVKALFHQALDAPEAERAALLRAACNGDESLRAHVAALLAAHQTPPGRLEGGGARVLLAAFEREAESVPPGARVGPYRVLAEIGRGGMGAVYRAVRDDGAFDQEVALKVVKRGMDTDEVVRRFVHERQILAALAHPHIARLLDGGTTADGRPYFVMEHIAGQPITRYAEQAGASVGERLTLFLAVAAAVQFAHQNLVVHRDLKPANILVGADGAPKLLDFGIAKLLDPDPLAPDTAAWTALAGAPLTPDYASPEQLAGRPVTTATDVHGLGVLLYELLVGANPKAVERELGAGWSARLPSQAAAALARARGQAEPRRLRSRLAGDLDTILGKALADDPRERYGTAGELADDVRRHLARLPVRARRPTLAYRLGRTVLRHRLASALALGLVVFSIAITVQTFELDRQRRRAEATTRFLVGLFKASDPAENRGAEIRVREVLDSGARILLEEPGAQPSWLLRELGGPAADQGTRVDLLLTIGEVQNNLGLRADAERSLQKARDLTGAGTPLGALPAERARHARALTLLGDRYRDDDKFDQSRAAYEQALGLLRQLPGRRSPEAATVLNALGLVSTATGAPERARSELEEALALWREAGAAGQPGAGLTLNNLGLLALERGDREEAGRRFGEALALLRRTLGEDHPDSLRVLSNLAALHFRQGDYARARQGFREVLRIKQRVLGADHPDLARTWNNLATAEIELGRLADAEVSLRRSLALLERHGQGATEVYADALNNLAAVVRDRGDLAAATRLAHQSRALYRQVLGPDHPKEASVLNGLARIELAAGRPGRAEAAAREGLALRRKAYGDEHRTVAASLELLARILEAQGRTAEAGRTARQAADLRRRLGT